MARETHWTEPYTRVDKRGMILAACGLRVYYKHEVDLRDPSCAECKRLFNQHEQNDKEIADELGDGV